MSDRPPAIHCVYEEKAEPLKDGHPERKDFFVFVATSDKADHCVTSNIASHCSYIFLSHSLPRSVSLHRAADVRSDMHACTCLSLCAVR